MKLFICSDIHGDAAAVSAVIEKFKDEAADKLVILGDVLYHGPRNDLPDGYAPKEVIKALNPMSNSIISVRGNCDTEVDQMVLSFPILSDYAYILSDGLTIIATHGHKFSPDNPPPLSAGDILLCGHTHVPKITPFGNQNFYINPGSVSLPKENNPKTYAIYENRTFKIKDFSGNVLSQKTF